ncbi:MAG: glycosyltransferase [Fibromonadaceae bacterium]|jgi:glycosyltransferase involved in cell wall biosynthesis|nr:glycosyltransferase [Fibromonadaceae bacterium]
MKTILLICTEPSAGVRTYSFTIANSLAKLRTHRVIFMYSLLNDDNDLDKAITKIPIELPKNKWLRLLFRIYPFKILNEINKIKNIDIIHLLSTEYAMANILGRLQKKHNVIYTVHDLIPHQQKGQKNVTLYLKYINFAMAKCHRICNNLCTCSLEQLKQLKTMYPQKKVFFHSMPNFITEITKKGNLICPELTGVKDYILFFGRVDAYKGIEILHKAFLSSKLKAKLVVAGKPVVNYNPFESSKKTEDVIFIDRFIETEEIKSLFENAKCVVYPYISITQSGVLSFPYYFGIPVIASGLSYFKDQIIDEKTGWLFETGNADDLAKKMQIAFNSLVDLEKMKLAQKEQFEILFGEEKLAIELKEVYNAF